MLRKRCRLIIFHILVIVGLGLAGVSPLVADVKAVSGVLRPAVEPEFSAGRPLQTIEPTPEPLFEDEFLFDDEIFGGAPVIDGLAYDEIDLQAETSGVVKTDTAQEDDPCASRTPGKNERCLRIQEQAGRAAGALTIEGNPLRLAATDDARLSVALNGAPQFFGGDHAGVYLWLNGKVYGPQPWGGGRDYTLVGSRLSGNGSPVDPWKAVTVVKADNLLQMTQEVTYVNGQNRLDLNWTLQNLTDNPLPYGLLHAADFTKPGDDYENGYYDASSGAVGGRDYTKTHLQYFVPRTPNYAYFEGVYTEVWDRIGYASPGLGFNNTIRPDYVDNGAGLQWNNILPPASTQSIKDALVFAAQSTLNYQISGRVLNSVGMPLVGVTVSASGGYYSMTDDQGNYALTNLPAGRYMLAAALKDYTFTTQVPMPVEVPRDQIMVDFLGTAAGSKVIDASLTSGRSVAQSALYALSGRITDNQGASLIGAAVTIDATHSGVTNSSGFYEIGGLAAGKYTLTPSMSGYAFTPATLSVTIPGRTTNLDFSATPTTTYTISGKVSRTGGTTGLIGIKVYADAHHMGLTDGEGNYAISGLTPGTYSVRAAWDGYQFTTTTVMPLTLSGNTTVDFSGEANPNWISGKVTVADTGYPLPGVTVSVGCGYSAVTDAAGQYTISGLSDQAYYVRASLKGFTFSTPSEAILPPSQESVNLVATPQTYLLQGTLLMGAQPLAGAEITSSSGSMAYTDLNGHFSMAGLSAGEHTLAAHLDGFLLSPASVVVSVPAADEVAFTAAPYEYTVSGQISSSADGTPVAGATVMLGSARKAVSNANGYYIFAGLPSGANEYAISAHQFGYTAVLSGSTSPITVPPSRIVNFTTTYNTKVGKIEGVLMNSNPNEYLSGVIVMAKPVEKQTCTAGEEVFLAVSDVNGFYQIGGLAGGEYEVNIAKAGYSFQPTVPYLTYAPSTALIFSGEAASGSYWVDGHILSVGSGLPGAYIYLREGAGNSTYANANGYFRIAGLPEGGYTIVPSLNFYTFNTSTAMPVRVGDGGGTPGATVDFEAANSSSATPMYFVSGMIKTPKGTPVPFVPLTLNPGGMSAISDRSGNYTLGWLTAGTYTIAPANPNSETNCQFVVKKSGSNPTPPLQVTLSETGGLESVTDGDFEATCTINVSGKIVDAAGAGVPGVAVLAKPSLTGNTVSATSAADGRFILAGLGEGIYTIIPTSNGYRYFPQSFQVNLPVNVSLPEFTAEMLPVMYRVSGVIRDAEGRPLSGVTISDNAGDMTITDASGAYELGFAIGNLPAGVENLEIVPSQEGFFFTPATRSIPVAPLNGRPPNPTAADLPGMDFRAVMQ